jgi:hypothetical protein
MSFKTQQDNNANPQLQLNSLIPTINMLRPQSGNAN